jgi:hypothetical protein
MLLCAVFGVVQAQQVSLDFSTNDWGLPEGSANKLTESKPFTNSDGYTVTLQAADGYYFNTQGYLMLGKAGSTLTLPAFTFKVSKIAVVGNSAASGSVEQNIFVGEEEVSTKTVGAKGTNEYVIASDKRAVGTIYTLKVLSAHNTQITQIKIYKEGEEGKSDPNLSFSVSSATATLGQDFTEPTLTNGGDGAVTYQSESTEIATVNATTGEVTPIAVGTTKITATSAETSNYISGTASYTLKVQEKPVTSDKTFDFTGTNDYGTGLTPSNGSDYIYEEKTWTSGDVTLVTSGRYRWWLADAGNDLRFYSQKDANDKETTKMVISVPSGYTITKIEITGGQQFSYTGDEGSYSSGKWEGSANSVTLTYASTSAVKVKTIDVTYSQGGDNPPPETVFNSIAEVIEKGGSGKLKFNNVQVLYVNGNDMFAKDNTGAIDFYFDKADGFNYTAGQKLNGTAVVTYKAYNEMPEITAVTDVSLTATSGTVTPVTITAAANLPDYVCQLVKVSGKFKKEGNNTYLTDGTNSVLIYNKWKLDDINLGQVVEGSEGTATGIVVTYKSNNQIIYEIALTALEYESAGLIDPQLSFDPAGPFEITFGEDFDEPTLLAAPDFDFGIVKYSSSNTYVATVDEATGKVEIIGSGTTTIKATSEANEEFLAGSASYTLTVNKAPVQPGTDKFVYVADASTLAAGDVIILVGTNTIGETETTYAMSDQSGNFRITEVVTPESDGSIFPNSYVQQITLEGAADAWYLNVGDNQYLYACSSKSNYMKTGTKEDAGDNAKAQITIEEGVVDEETQATGLLTTILFQGENTRNDIRFNYNDGNTPRFACYDHDKTKTPRVKIYRKVKSGSLLGDANNDGKINISDVTAIINYMLGYDPTPFNFDNANVKKDEYINIQDVTGVINILLQ